MAFKLETRLGQNPVYGWTVYGQYAKIEDVVQKSL